jgi:hypothetical protein
MVLTHSFIGPILPTLCSATYSIVGDVGRLLKSYTMETNHVMEANWSLGGQIALHHELPMYDHDVLALELHILGELVFVCRGSEFLLDSCSGMVSQSNRNICGRLNTHLMGIG